MGGMSRTRNVTHVGGELAGRGEGAPTDPLAREAYIILIDSKYRPPHSK
jgi:hypothetical protein